MQAEALVRPPLHLQEVIVLVASVMAVRAHPIGYLDSHLQAQNRSVHVTLVGHMLCGQCARWQSINHTHSLFGQLGHAQPAGAPARSLSTFLPCIHAAGNTVKCTC